MAVEAALLSRAVGKPVRVQWMRQDEHGWDPKGPAMVMEVRGAVDNQGTVATPVGRGIAFSRYENNEAYTAVVAQVKVDRGVGQVRLQRLVVAQDAGLIIKPDGITNQLEGNLIQAASRALKEEMNFDRSRITSVDWASYPILTFPEIPTIDVVLINHPDQPAYGAGEPSTLPVAPAIANAVFDATGARVRTIRLTANRVMAALAATSTTG